MKKHLEKHKIASLVILVLVILIISLLFTPQFKPIIKSIKDIIIPNPEENPLYDDYIPQPENQEANQTGIGGGSSENPAESGTPFNESIEYLNSENYRTCLHTLLIQKCKEYLMPSDEITYTQGPGYVKCYNQFSSDSAEYQEIKINVPFRILYNRCGYQPKLTLREKCLKNMYIDMCLENDLEYTEYNTALGILICTDDGFYIEEDYNIHEKFVELEITQEAINNRCGEL